MKINEYSEVILNGKDIINGLYSEKIKSLKYINFEDNNLVEQFNKSIELNADNIELASTYVQPTCTVEEFDKINQSQWFIPEFYKKFDIADWLLSQCKTQIETDRVVEELELFVQYEMIDVLVCLKYLVDFMRENKIVWGLGRGSSVASYCLFLIGVHKIDSLKFSLDIREFLKGDKNEQESLQIDAG
jgi:DNA polymerase III alpha subunit